MCRGVLVVLEVRLNLAATDGVTGLVPEDLGAGLERVVRERRARAGQWRMDADIDRARTDAGRAAVARRAAGDVAGGLGGAAVRRTAVGGATVGGAGGTRCRADRARSAGHAAAGCARDRTGGARAWAAGDSRAVAGHAGRTARLQRRSCLRLEPARGRQQGGR